MARMPTKVVTVAQMQALESASERAGVSTDTLMENAGLACARFIRQHMGGAAGRKVLLLIGPGNNGADGLVIARHLRRWGSGVCCYIVRGRPDHDPKMSDALSYGVDVMASDDDPGFARLTYELATSSVVVDAILGAGRYRPLEGTTAEVVRLANRRKDRGTAGAVISVDLPTGVNPDTGAADDHAIRADVTLALCCPKFGIANFPGAAHAGRIVEIGIGLPDTSFDGIDLPVEWMTDSSAASLAPRRPLDSHKGSYGHLLIIAGSRNFVGASVLAAMGAHRSGAGLVTLATPQSVYPMAAAKLTETIHLPLPEDADGRISPSAADLIVDRIGSYSALAVGCGLGRSAGTASFMARLLLGGAGAPELPTVIDADGLNNLADCADWARTLQANAVLTPHPGEMSTLTGKSTPDVQAHRISVATRAATDWGQTVLLKGAHSIVAEPGGNSCILPFANPALAAGGTGDVLTGIIGGLLAQGVAPYDAARLAGFVHGTAGAKARDDMGSSGVIASDLLTHIPGIMERLRSRAW